MVYKWCSCYQNTHITVQGSICSLPQWRVRSMLNETNASMYYHLKTYWNFISVVYVDKKERRLDWKKLFCTRDTLDKNRDTVQHSLLKTTTTSVLCKKNAKYLSVKQKSCHFQNIHFNFSHVTPIQGIIQAVLFCLLLPACQFKWQTSEMLEKERPRKKKNLCSGKAVI